MGPRPGNTAVNKELVAFTEDIKDALALQSNTVRSVPGDTLDADEFHGFHLAFTATRGKDLCQLRITTYISEGKLIFESKARWGSVIDEMEMLRQINENLVSPW